MTNIITTLFRNLSLINTKPVLCCSFHVSAVTCRKGARFVEKPKPGDGQAFRRIVHYPEEYTIKPLKVTNLAGRDPVTGRVVAKGIGGGIKHKFHWIKWERDGPAEGPPQEERVLRIFKCGCRTANVALVGVGDQLKYILATEKMKPGDIIKTSRFIPRNAVKPRDGDSYPLGALPLGTVVHCIARLPDSGPSFVHAAGTYATVKRHVGGKVIVQLPSKHEMALHPECMASVGRLSNIEHSSTPVGSAGKNRELGNRPRSGLWQRKTGRCGRKIRPLPPVKVMEARLPPPPERLRLTFKDIIN